MVIGGKMWLYNFIGVLVVLATFFIGFLMGNTYGQVEGEKSFIRGYRQGFKNGKESR